ncbi:MAG: MFS transporter [Planctomycetota bacterium]
MDKKMSFVAQVRSLPANFWFANSMEMLERLAFFGVRAITPLYLVASTENNGLGLDYKQKGLIYTIWALLQCLIPMVSGGYTDRYGYKKSLGVAFTINIIGYLGMAQSKPIADYLVGRGWEGAGFWVFMAAACCIGLGTAIFKPPVAATVARSTNEETSSVTWGIFYWVVNIGGGLAPMGAALLRCEIDWQMVFYAAAIVTACNFLPMLFLYKEPQKVRGDEKSHPEKGPVGVFVSSIVTIFSDLRLVVFLGIFSCFYLMFMQLWDLLPNFIDEWVDTSDVAAYFGWISDSWILKSGQTKPEMVINIDSAAIIGLVIPISWLISKMNKVTAMIIGMVIALVGFVGAGMTSLGWLCCLMVFTFAIGEMTCSPTFNAYVGLIAPPDRKALYMGYSNLPFAFGWAAGNALGGFIYEATASKFKLARHYLIDCFGMDPSVVLDEKFLSNKEVMENLAWLMGPGDGVSIQEATQMLWDLHHPYVVWLYLGAIGLVGTIGMIIFYYITKKPAKVVPQQSQPT